MADNSDITLPPPDPPDPDLNTPNQSHSQSQSYSTSTTIIMADSSTAAEHLSSSPNSSSSTPPWVIWSRGLNNLLDDPQGQDLFKTYLEDEGCYLQLTFLWAICGLKQTINDPPKIPDLIRKIYRVFIPNLIGLTDSTRSELAQAIVDGRFTEIEIFYKAENEVLTHMKENLYPNFLKSEIYLSACNGEDSSSGSGSGRERRQSEGDESVVSAADGEHDHMKFSHSPPPAIDPLTGMKAGLTSPTSLPFESVQQILAPNPNQLQTVHEDKELSMAAASQITHSKSKKHFGLTKEALMATEFQRATEFQGKVRKSDAGPSINYFVKHPYHASYSSYNPVSRVDSEIQSMSSDAMTDDGGTSASRRHHGHSEQRRHDDRSSHRSHCRGSGDHGQQQQRHSHPVEKSRRHLSGMPTGAPLNNIDDLKQLPKELQIFNKSRPPGHPDAEKDPAGFAGVIMEKLHNIIVMEEQRENVVNYKDILAQAISKIHSQEESPSDIIDMHFTRVTHLSDVTPKSKSPKLRSPTVGRRRGPLPPAPPVYPVPTRRRERDFIQSTFSVDSGNVPDSESLAQDESRGIPKSRSIPYELRGQQDFRRPPPVPFGSNPRGYHHPHPPRGFLGKVPLGMFKKPSSMEFIDSGISTVSGQSTNLMPPPSTQQQHAAYAGGPIPDRRIHDWVAQSHSDSFGLSMGFAQSQRRMRKPNPPELEDVREKLVQTLDLHSSSRPPPRHSPPSSGSSETVTESMNSNCVHALVSYDDNRDVPYILKIPRLYDGNEKPGTGSRVTLAALKERLPRQGQFRYFFRTECLELGSTVVQEEISNNYQELPMLNGKIFAHLKAIPGPGSQI